MQNPNPSITIPVPIYVKVSKKNTFSINLNEYRNAHFHVLNKAKVVFAEMIAPVLATIPAMLTTKLHFKLFFGSNRDVDTANVCSIVEKFFCDAMVSHGILEDDNRRFLVGSTSDFGGVDTKNPRVEVTFYDYELKPKEQKPMRLVLTQAEIASILINHFLPILAGGEEKVGNFHLHDGEDGVTVGVLDILHPASEPEKLPEAPVTPVAPPVAPKVSKARQAAPAKPVQAVTPVTLVATAEGVAAVAKTTLGDVIEAAMAEVREVTGIKDAMEGESDRGDIFDLTPRTNGIEMENDAQDAAEDAAEAASHEDQSADAGTKEETPAEAPVAAKPALDLFPKGDEPKPASAPGPDRRGLFAAQLGTKPTPKEEAPASKAGPVGSLFAGLSKPKHVPATSGT